MKLSQQITLSIVSALALGLVATYGLAQPKPGTPEKKAPATAVADAGASAGGACGTGPCTHGHKECPMHSLLALADVKIEKTKTGATLQLTAKDGAKVAEVQALAEKIGEHMKSGECPMMKGGEGHHHDHDHDHHHGQPAAPAK